MQSGFDFRGAVSVVRIGLIGAGVIGKRHIAAISTSGVAELVAIADPSPESRELAAKHAVPHFSGAAEMMETVSPDGVIVATPTEHHLKPTLTALDAGAHVLVEKPIAETVSQARQIIDACRSAGRHVLVGHHRRYYECVRTAREIIDRGDLGRLVAVTGQWTVRKHDSYYLQDWRRRRAAGPVLTNLIHDMDTLRAICGEIQMVSGETANGVLGFDKEDAAAIVMRFASGALGTFLLSDQACSPWGWEFGTGENPAFPRSGQNSMRFVGTEGALEFPNLVLWKSAGDKCDWNTPMASMPIPARLDDAFVLQIRHFAEVIRGETLPRIGAADATRTLAATVAVFDAARSGKRVSL